MSSPTAWATAPSPTVSLKPTSNFRRAVGWAVDLIVVAAVVGLVYVLGLIRINGCDTWDPATQQFGGSCPFAQTREITHADGSIDLVYVLGSGRELPADHPTVKTVLFGTRVVDPPSKATYLVGLGYVLLVFVVLQGLTGWTPGKALAGTRLVKVEGGAAGAGGGDRPEGPAAAGLASTRSSSEAASAGQSEPYVVSPEGAPPPGIPAAFLRWLAPDGFIGLVGVILGLVAGPWILRLLAADGALGILNGVGAVLNGGRTIGDRIAGTMVVDERFAARRHRTKKVSPSADRAVTETSDDAAAALAGTAARPAEWQAGWASPPAPGTAPLEPTGAPERGEPAYPGAAGMPGAEPSSTAWLGSTPGATAAPPTWRTSGEWTPSQPAGTEQWAEPTPADRPVPTQAGQSERAESVSGESAAAGAAPASPGAPVLAGEASPLPDWLEGGPSKETSPSVGAGQPGSAPRPEAEPSPEVTAETPAPGTAGTTAPGTAGTTAPGTAGTTAPGTAETTGPGTAETTGPATTEGPAPRTGAEAPAAAGTAPAGGWEAAPPLWDPRSRRQAEAGEAESTEPAAAPMPGASGQHGRDSAPVVGAQPEPAAAATRTTVDDGDARQPRWDEARQAYIFWDDARQEWLQFDYEAQQWGPITRA